MRIKHFHGKKLAEARRLRGLSQIELAERVNGTQTSVSYHEQNRHVPRPEMLRKYATVLGVPLSFLADVDITMPTSIGREGLRNLLLEKFDHAHLLASAAAISENCEAINDPLGVLAVLYEVKDEFSYLQYLSTHPSELPEYARQTPEASRSSRREIREVRKGYLRRAFLITRIAE